MNCSRNMIVVSVSKLHRRTCSSLRVSPALIVFATNILRTRKKTWAHNGFGKPKMPDDIAGIDTVLHSSSFA